MQILINIPEVYESESELNLIVKNGTVTYVSMGGSCHEEFECTVLPKGHGRLIDADKLYPDKMTKDGSMAISQGQLAYATKTVIKADKE